MPFGVVFLPWAGVKETEIREHFRAMKQLGFHNLKQVGGTPEWPATRVMEIAIEEGVIPFWYGEAGWQAASSALLRQLGIPDTLSKSAIRKHTAMVAYQMKHLAKGIADAAESSTFLEGGSASFRHTPDPFLTPADVPFFQRWLRANYASPDALAQAWNEYETGISDKPIKTWDDMNARTEAMSKQANTLRGYGGEYGRVRDVLRFKAELHAKSIEERSVAFHQRSPDTPTRTGGEMGLFLPFAWRATNMEQLAQTQLNTGSFYPSIHFAWHFGEVGYEVARPIYMQASFANDLFKGGWVGGWESTAGPQQLTGGKGWNAAEQNTTAGFTVNAGTMTQLLLSYLAAGFKGAGLWTWNYREAGWEGGEFALLNRQRKPSERAVRAGLIAQAAEQFRDELWRSHKEPTVGVLLNWDSDAIWAAMSLRGRDHFKHYPMQARVGVSRALINGNIPFEYVTIDDLRAGLAPRYRVIYLSGQIALSEEVLSMLTEYARQGGRVVLDSPGAMYDESGKVLKTGLGSPFEKLFGAEVTDFQYANNVPKTIDGLSLHGFISELHSTTAGVQAHFQDRTPAVLNNKIGGGSAVLLAWDASYAAFKPDHAALESALRKYALSGIPKQYSCEGAIVYRLAGPDADHYFFINDGDAKTVTLATPGYRYLSGSDGITHARIAIGGPIKLEANSGRWIRLQKSAEL